MKLFNTVCKNSSPQSLTNIKGRPKPSHNFKFGLNCFLNFHFKIIKTCGLINMEYNRKTKHLFIIGTFFEIEKIFNILLEILEENSLEKMLNIPFHQADHSEVSRNWLLL